MAMVPLLKHNKMELKTPKVGQIVHYYPNENDSISRANNAQFVPAIIVQSFGPTCVNLQVFTMNGDAPNVLRYSVQHESAVTFGASQSFWDYAEQELTPVSESVLETDQEQ